MKRFHRILFLPALVFPLTFAACDDSADAGGAATQPGGAAGVAPDKLESALEGKGPLALTDDDITPPNVFISPAQLQEKIDAGEKLVIIDARNAEEFEAGHIAGAINLPPDSWRTGKANPGEGHSQYVFRTGDETSADYGSTPVDVGRYEKMLSAAGITNDHEIVVYGNHAGKGDGSVPAMILHMLGHPLDKLFVVNGKGFERWASVSGNISKGQAMPPTPAEYKAEWREKAVWSLDDVQAAVKNRKGVVFYDTRGQAEWDGDDTRDNQRPGRLPGAVRINYTDLMTDDMRVMSARDILETHQSIGIIMPDQPVVLYCQTATRVSLPYLALVSMGFTNVHIYDASWHEYGNRADTVIEGEATPATQPQS